VGLLGFLLSDRAVVRFPLHLAGRRSFGPDVIMRHAPLLLNAAPPRSRRTGARARRSRRSGWHTLGRRLGGRAGPLSWEYLLPATPNHPSPDRVIAPFITEGPSGMSSDRTKPAPIVPILGDELRKASADFVPPADRLYRGYPGASTHLRAPARDASEKYAEPEPIPEVAPGAGVTSVLLDDEVDTSSRCSERVGSRRSTRGVA
jgi:hypothetical protein